MPELPEVETVRRVLLERLAGRRVTAVVVPRKTFYRRPPAAALAELEGAALAGASRRGKYLTLEFEGRRALTLHLGMSGRLLLAPAGEAAHAHERFRMDFGDVSMRFVDPRRFGRVACPLPDFGPEPLDEGFDGAALKRAFRGRRAPVKALLLDQGLMAGVGNIYATEALYKAGIRPGRAARALTLADCEALARALKDVLAAGIAAGGATLDDEAFLDPLGRPGRAHLAHAVYGRKTGACGHALAKTRRMMGGRQAVYCPVCQR